MDSPCIKQTVCKVLKIFQYGKYLVAYVLKGNPVLNIKQNLVKLTFQTATSSHEVMGMSLKKV